MTHWSVFQSLLDQIKHEDDLLAFRTQWLMIGQSLLFIAYFCIDKRKLPADRPLNHHRLVSLLGTFSTMFILAAILSAIKVFVELRTDMSALIVQHHDLPMRRLPRVGIGAGLICPILLSCAILFAWSLLASSRMRVAVLMTVSGSLFSLHVIGGAHEFPTATTRALFLWPTLIGGIALLITALWLGWRSMRSSSAA